MNWLEENTLPILFIVVLMLIFGNIWAVQSDRQAEADHQRVMGYQTELKLNQTKE